jgi:hypothetical protein
MDKQYHIFEEMFSPKSGQSLKMRIITLTQEMRSSFYGSSKRRTFIPWQGDQMSLFKNCPNLFLLKVKTLFLPEKNVAQNLGYL